ncbi:hypothetical protein [Paraburkholderia fungorum]
MFDEDADDSRARAEQGRKNAEFRDLMDSIRLDIKDQADAGANKTTYKVSKSSREFIDAAVERLTDDEYNVKVTDANGERPVLHISWEPNS